MREIDYTFSRHPTAWAFLATAMILAGTFASSAHGQPSGSRTGTETLPSDVAPEAGAPDRGTPVVAAAWALPQVASGGAVALPQPLRSGDAALMHRVFLLQARGDLTGADPLLAAVQDPLLRGTALADRYLGPRHRSTAAELSEWLEHYSDLPDAPAVHALLLSRLPNDAARPAAPRSTALVRSPEPDPMPEDIDPPRNNQIRNVSLERAVLDRVDDGNTASALRLIARTRGLSPAYAALLRAKVAQMLFTQNEDAEALRIAQVALHDTKATDQPALAFYVAGLAAWRLDRIEQARAFFEGGAQAANTSAHLHAASALWASRANRTLHDVIGTLRWLLVAAQERLTLHGLLARRILRMDTGIPPSPDIIRQTDVDAIAATTHGQRAFALLQAGQADRAEAELRSLWADALARPEFGRSLLLVTAAAGLTDCASQMAAAGQPRDGQRHDIARSALPRLHPSGGFRIDPPLVYALTRLESNFTADAVSPVGARGLMQIMPATAKYIMGDHYNADRLDEPAANLEIGQRYLVYLARQPSINNDLMRTLASYNSGPGNFYRWGADIRDHADPLLFIEAIPVAETRAFVPHALAYSWIYAAWMHLPAPSLDSLAAGEFPRFTPPRPERTVALLAPD